MQGVAIFEIIKSINKIKLIGSFIEIEFSKLSWIDNTLKGAA